MNIVISKLKNINNELLYDLNNENLMNSDDDLRIEIQTYSLEISRCIKAINKHIQSDFK